METEEKYAEKPWRRLHDLIGLPETLEELPVGMTYTKCGLDEPARKFPNNLALVYLDYEMTFKELKDHVDRFATALSAMGIKKGDVVATAMTSSIQFVIADFAIPEIGAIHAPMSILDSIDDLVTKVNIVKPKMVICSHTNVKDRDVIDKVKEAVKKTDMKEIILTNAEDYSSNPPKHEWEEGIIWFTDLIEKYPSNPPKVDIDPKKDIAMVLFTGGTTGFPKAAMYSHYDLAMMTRMAGGVAPPYLLSIGEGLPVRALLPLPLFHVLGHHTVYEILAMGMTVLMQKDPRDIKEYIRLAKKYHPLVQVGAPPQFMKLVKEEGVKGLGMAAISSGAPLPADTQRGFEKKAGSLMGQVYGPTECGVLTTVSVVDLLLPILGSYERIGKLFHLIDIIFKTPGVTASIEGLKRIAIALIDTRTMGDTIGRMGSTGLRLASSILTSPSGREKEVLGSVGVVLAGSEPKITDLDTGEKIPISRVVKEKLSGELWIKSPAYPMSGFWPDRGRGIDEEGFIPTGDVATIDKTGHVYIVDRVKDIALVGGYDVYPEQLDDLLYKYPGVDEVATVGIPDPEREGSERIKVFIAPLPEYKGKIKEEEIINYLKEKVAPYAVPKSVEFRDIDEFPRTTAGMDKIAKRKLREEEIEKMKNAGILE